MYSSDKIWLINCASEVSIIKKCNYELKTLLKHEGDSEYIEKLKSEYLEKLNDISDLKNFFVYMLNEFCYDKKLHVNLWNNRSKFIISLMDSDYSIFSSHVDPTIDSSSFIKKLSSFTILEDFDILVDWYNSYVENPKEAIKDMTDQIVEDELEKLRKLVDEIRSSIAKDQQSLDECNEFLKGKRALKPNWYNTRFHQDVLDFQEKKQELIQTIDSQSAALLKNEEAIKDPSNIRTFIEHRVSSEFKTKLVSVQWFLVLFDIIKEIQFRINEKDKETPINKDTLSLMNKEINDNYYYYFEYYFQLYKIRKHEENLNKLCQERVFKDDIIKEFEDEEDKDFLIQDQIEEIKKYFDKFDRNRTLLDN